MMIDPIEAVLNILKADSALMNVTAERVAVQHKFALDDNAQGQAWPTPSKALTITSLGDIADTSSSNHPVFRGKVTVNCFAESGVEARLVWNAIEETLSLQQRRVVSTSNGDALVYFCHLDGAPTAAFDQELNIDYLTGTASYRIYKHAV